MKIGLSGQIRLVCTMVKVNMACLESVDYNSVLPVYYMLIVLCIVFFLAISIVTKIPWGNDTIEIQLSGQCTKRYLGSFQISMMDFFGKIVNS